MRVEPEDFVVEEDLGFTPSGEGAHVLLSVRKRAANTEWVARELARHAGCRPADVGYAGLKDRHAVTTQWFSVPRDRAPLERWLEVIGEGYRVLTAAAHARKLPRGALAGNRFSLRVREVTGDRAEFEARLARLGERGAPDYFGPQRFGRDLANLSRALEGDFHRDRGFTLSAARSLVFNAVLAERVADGSWCRLEAGDVANLDGRGSVFPVTALDESLATRVAALDVHPTGPLWGAGSTRTAARIAELEARVCASFATLCDALDREGLAAARRPLRVAVRDLEYAFEDATLVLRFRLTGGSFATAVLREVMDARDDR